MDAPFQPATRASNSGPEFFIVAGEPSGDNHASQVMAEMRRLNPACGFRGFGGAKMRAQGLECMEDLPAQAIMGIFPVLAALPKIRSWFRQALDDLVARPPAAIILVDYPGFNLRLAAKAKALGIPVIYYISPQVWAWNRRRVKKIKKIVDLMICILPFEEKFYQGSGVQVYYPGHPLMDHMAAQPPRPEELGKIRERHAKAKPLIAVFPGSRDHVVRSLAPDFGRAIQRVLKTEGLQEAQFAVAAASPELKTIIEALPEYQHDAIAVYAEQSAEVMIACDIALTTSGTTTLELAGHLKPMVVAYKVSRAFWLIGRMVIKVPYISLVNLIANRALVPELISYKAFDAELARALTELTRNDAKRQEMTQGLIEVKTKLQAPGSYHRTAARILAEVDTGPSPKS